jgi:UDP:flavonoid glycosyltransferase YjiC (YdhE family)
MLLHAPLLRSLGPSRAYRRRIARILFTFAGGAGHFEPLVPVAEAARTAGHEVAFTCAAGMVPAVARRGFAVTPTVPGETAYPPARRPLVPADAEHELQVLRDYYGGRLKRSRAAGIADRCEQWRPDLLVCDEADFGCAEAAARHGLLLAVVHVGAPDFVPDDLAIGADLVLSPFPAAYRPGGARRFRAHDAAPATGGELYFTLGTIFPLECGDLFTRVLAGLDGLPVTVSVGPHLDPAELGPQPPGVRVERHVDQAELLPRCRLMISHGGSGSVLAALAHGLPSVLLPIGADQPWNARRCQELGVARVLDPVHATPDEIRAAVADAAECRPAAARLQREIARLPAAADVVPLLEALTR